MNAHLSPYGHRPVSVKVVQIFVLYFGWRFTRLALSSSKPTASSWTKRHRFPYGQDPFSQKFLQRTVLYADGLSASSTLNSASPWAYWHRWPYGQVPVSVHVLHSSRLYLFGRLVVAGLPRAWWFTRWSSVLLLLLPLGLTLRFGQRGASPRGGALQLAALGCIPVPWFHAVFVSVSVSVAFVATGRFFSVCFGVPIYVALGLVCTCGCVVCDLVNEGTAADATCVSWGRRNGWTGEKWLNVGSRIPCRPMVMELNQQRAVGSLSTLCCHLFSVYSLSSTWKQSIKERKKERKKGIVTSSSFLLKFFFFSVLFLYILNHAPITFFKLLFCRSECEINAIPMSKKRKRKKCILRYI